MRIGVVGAGMTGLAAAWEAARRGHDVTVFEARGEVGGLASSGSWRGFRIDFGPHRLHAGAPGRVLALYRGLLGDDLVVRPRAGAIHLEGRAEPVKYPLAIPQIVKALGASKAARVAASAVAARVSMPGPARDFAEGVSRRLGTELYELLYGPAARKMWGVDPRELDAALARARVMRKGPLDVVLGALKRGSTRPGATYLYPRRGAGQLAESFACALDAAGAKVRLRHRVKRLGARHVDGEPFDAVITSAPLNLLGRMLGDPDVAAPAADLRFRAMAVVYALVARERVSEEDVHYFPSARLPFARIFEAKRFSGGVGPEGRTVLGFDCPLDRAEPRWARTGGEWLDDVTPGFEALGVRRDEVLGMTVRRRAEAYPMYLRGFAPKRDRALDALARYEGLYVAGRGGLFVHNNINHAIEAGLDAADAALSQARGRDWRDRARAHLDAVITD